MKYKSYSLQKFEYPLCIAKICYPNATSFISLCCQELPAIKRKTLNVWKIGVSFRRTQYLGVLDTLAKDENLSKIYLTSLSILIKRKNRLCGWKSFLFRKSFVHRKVKTKQNNNNNNNNKSFKGCMSLCKIKKKKKNGVKCSDFIHSP